jgi:DNA-directed RNA polymerase specialized sigma subunit
MSATRTLPSTCQSRTHKSTPSPQEEWLDAVLPLVRRIARRIHHRLPPGVELAALIQAGVLGSPKPTRGTTGPAGYSS